MSLVTCLDELGRDSYLVADLSRASFQDIVPAQLFSDLGYVLVSVLVLHRGGARDNAQTVGVQTPQLSDHFLGQAVSEIVLCGVAAEVSEGQYRQHHLPIGGFGLREDHAPRQI